jgi:hypothetical protein
MSWRARASSEDFVLPYPALRSSRERPPGGRDSSSSIISPALFRLPPHLRLDWNSGWISHRFPSGYTYELHQHIFWPSNVPGSLLAKLNLPPSRSMHVDCEAKTEASTRRCGRLLYFPIDLPILWDSIHYVCKDGDKHFSLHLRCTYHVMDGAVAMVPTLDKQEVSVWNAADLVPLADWETWLPCEDGKLSVNDRIVKIGDWGKGPGLSE